MNPFLVRAALLFAGFALWAVFSILPPSGAIHEAWDRAPYWQIGVPLLLLAQIACATVSHEKLSRLPLWTLGGHFLAMLAVHPIGTDLGLLPLAFVFIGLPSYGALFLVSLAARKLTTRFA